MDVLGKALLDFQSGNYTEDITTFSSLNQKDKLPLPYFFRNFQEMPQLEQRALELCKGKVLDVGCGAGSHSLYLQNKGLDVVGLDQSLGAIKVCGDRGLVKTECIDFLSYSASDFDTLLLLMNGVGIAGKLKGLREFLSHAKSLMKAKGQILLDSSDIIYMFEKDKDGGHWVPGNVKYYGEVTFEMSYKNETGPVFDWLYLDFNTLKEYAHMEKMQCELIVEGEHYDYLARLTIK